MADCTLVLAPLSAASACWGVVVFEVLPPELPPPELHPASTSTSGTSTHAQRVRRKPCLTCRSTAGNLRPPVP